MGPEQLVEDLKKDLATGRVLVVVGTGVSIAASGNDPRASWAGLIRDGIERCQRLGLIEPAEAKTLLDSLAKETDNTALIAIAKQLEAKLKGRELRRWLKDSAGGLPITKRQLIEAIHALGATIATTNYDDLLSRGRGLEAIPWKAIDDVRELINGDRRGILHFHGFYKVPDSVILGEESYRGLLDAHGAQTMQKVLATINAFLFIGCGTDGLSDPNVGALLDWIATEFKDSIYRHYSLCLDSERATLQARHPALSFIGYGADYDDLTPALHKLAPVRRLPAKLPPEPHCFGREREVKTLVAALLGKNPDSIPILGGPGMGKTTIALKAIHDKKIARRFGSRRWFVRCDGAKTRAEVVAAIALALGLDITPELEPRVVVALANGGAALILDNAETPLDGTEPRAVEDFLALLASIDTLALIVTIRNQHRPIAVPWGSTIEAGRLSEDAARKAFLAASGKPTFAKDPHLGTLLAALDGAALAITLMGRFAEAFPSLDLVWQRWTAKKTAMLSAGGDRLTDLAISYELSIEALTAEARRLLSVLALLPEGAAHIDLAGIFTEPDRAADALRGRALIEDEGARVRMLAPLREHVAAAHPPESEDEAHAVRYYLALAAEEGRNVGRDGGAEAVLRLTPEVANIEALFARATVEDAEAMDDAVFGWTNLVRFSGLGSAAAFDAVRARAAAGGLTGLQARCFLSMGLIALARADHETARTRYEEALPLYRKVSYLLGEANCILSLGDIALRSDHETARGRYEEALPLYRKVGHLLGEANCIKSLGDIALRRSEHEAARGRYEEALPLYRKVGALVGEANCIRSLGDIALRRSEHETARGRYEEALPLYRKVGDLLGEANCIQSLGDIALERLDYETARGCYEEALPLVRKEGSLLAEANCIRGLGDLASDSGNILEAGLHYREALALYERIPEPHSIGGTHWRLALLASDDARTAHVEAARAAWRSIGRDDLVAELDAEFGGE